MSNVSQPKPNEICPTCDNTLSRVDIPKHELLTCTACGSLFQQDGSFGLFQLDTVLARSKMGDDRARSAVSSPHVSSVKSFLEVFDVAYRGLELGLAEAKGGLRTVLAQAENRLDYALGQLSGLGLASDVVSEAVLAITEARELISPLPGKNRGLPPKEIHVSAISPTEQLP